MQRLSIKDNIGRNNYFITEEYWVDDERKHVTTLLHYFILVVSYIVDTIQTTLTNCFNSELYSTI